MFKSISYDACHCKSRLGISSGPRVQIEKILDNKFKNVKTQTEPVINLEEQVANLLSEVADLEEKKIKTGMELNLMKDALKRNEENCKQEKLKNQEEIVRLMEANVELETNVSRIKIDFFEEKQKLLAEVRKIINEINLLKNELSDKKEVENRQIFDLKTCNLMLEQKLKHATADLKTMQGHNEAFQVKIQKYKHKLRYLTKYMKNMMDVQSCNKKDTMVGKEENQITSAVNSSVSIAVSPEKSNSNKCTSNSSKITNVALVTTVKPTVPDIENLVLTELFFKPKQVSYDTTNLFYSNKNNSNLSS